MKLGISTATDFIGNSNSGNGAPFINSRGQLQQNVNTTLLEDEHRRIDAAVLAESRAIRGASEHLRTRGLVVTLGSIGVLLSDYNRAGNMTDAEVDFDGRSRGLKDRLTFDQVGVPIPIFHKEWELGARQLTASRNGNSRLDTTQAQIATEIVQEKFESHIFNGLPGLTLDGRTVYGYNTHPDRNTYTLLADWTSAAAGAAMITDLINMLKLLKADNQRGPFMVYVGDNIWPTLEQDYSTAKGDNTILQRMLAIRGVEGIENSEFMDADTVTVVQMKSKTVDLAIAADLQNIQWSVQPMSTNYMVYLMGAVRVKSEKNGQCGIVHAT
jgi:hypothetical protein